MGFEHGSEQIQRLDFRTKVYMWAAGDLSTILEQKTEKIVTLKKGFRFSSSIF